jgi:hypothetical protein
MGNPITVDVILATGDKLRPTAFVCAERRPDVTGVSANAGGGV